MLDDLANDGWHLKRQLGTERDGDTENGCQKPVLQQKTTDDDDSGFFKLYKIKYWTFCKVTYMNWKI